jgi:hypothetical protein
VTDKGDLKDLADNMDLNDVEANAGNGFFEAPNFS